MDIGRFNSVACSAVLLFVLRSAASHLYVAVGCYSWAAFECIELHGIITYDLRPDTQELAFYATDAHCTTIADEWIMESGLRRTGRGLLSYDHRDSEVGRKTKIKQ